MKMLSRCKILMRRYPWQFLVNSTICWVLWRVLFLQKKVLLAAVSLTLIWIKFRIPSILHNNNLLFFLIIDNKKVNNLLPLTHHYTISTWIVSIGLHNTVNLPMCHYWLRSFSVQLVLIKINVITSKAP